MAKQYQLFARLRDEEYAALKADIKKRGVLIPVELDDSGRILDGHHRKEIADELGIKYPTKIRHFKTEAEKREHVIKINMARRHLEPHEWGAAFKRLLAERGVRRGKGSRNDKGTSPTIGEVAAELGVAESVAYHRLKLSDEFDALPESAREDIANRKSTVSKEAKKRRDEEKQRQREAEAKEAKRRAKKIPGIIRGDFREVGNQVADASCVLVFTDPPYDRQSLPMFSDLSAFANRVLVDGGSLITFCGQYVLDDVMRRLSEHLAFFWICCCLHSGNTAEMREYGIKVKWKPMLWFVKGQFRRDRTTWVDDLVKSEQQKTHHAWQQGINEAAYYIAKLSEEGELIADPFCGGGTTAFAAKQSNRKFWTCEVDGASFEIAKERLS